MSFWPSDDNADMYVATMEYPLKSEADPQHVAGLWKEVVLPSAQGRPGLIRMQLYSAAGALLAVGTWRHKDDAEAFMRTGVFVTLKEALGPWLAGDPRPRLWSEEAFLSS